MSEKLTKWLYFGIAGISLIFAIVCFAMSGLKGSFEYSYNEYYGGDAYTGIQNVGVDVSRNVREVGKILIDFSTQLTTCFGFVLFVVALIFAVKGIKCIIGDQNISTVGVSQRGVRTTSAGTATTTNSGARVGVSNAALASRLGTATPKNEETSEDDGSWLCDNCGMKNTRTATYCKGCYTKRKD